MTVPAILAALDAEAERIAKLPELDRAAELSRTAKAIDLPIGTLERRVAAHRGGAVVVDAAQLGRRLAKLIWALGSPDTAGAAVEALERALREAGRDWSYLAALVERAEPAPEVTDEVQSWIAAGERILAASARLEGRELDFVTDMMRRFSLGWAPTEKQGKWLAAIHNRYVAR